MSCSPYDLKDYFFGELAWDQRAAVEQHASSCVVCREELSSLDATRGVLLSVGEEEPPRRIAFVSDKVFEPKWWQRIWQSGPQLGFVSACILALAILTHGFVGQRQVESAVQKAVAEVQRDQATQMLAVQDYIDRMHKQRALVRHSAYYGQSSGAIQ